ncbi:MAG TPA: hypothetical protein VI278_17620 [Nitrososphaeraceae archaeon]|jgi:hypothetical protein
MHKEVLHARGLECDDRISKLSEEKLKETLEEVRKLRRRRRTTYHNVSDNDSRIFYVTYEYDQLPS